MAMSLAEGIEKYSKEPIKPPDPNAKWLLWCSDGDPDTEPKLDELTYDNSKKWYRLTRYYPLSLSDISHWPSFCSRLNDDRNANTPNPGRRIWQRLSIDSQSLIKKSTTGIGLKHDDRQSVVEELRKILKQYDLFESLSFGTINPPADVDKAKKILNQGLKNFSPREIQLVNQILMVHSFFPHIRTNYMYDLDRMHIVDDCVEIAERSNAECYVLTTGYGPIKAFRKRKAYNIPGEQAVHLPLYDLYLEKRIRSLLEQIENPVIVYYAGISKKEFRCPIWKMFKTWGISAVMFGAKTHTSSWSSIAEKVAQPLIDQRQNAIDSLAQEWDKDNPEDNSAPFFKCSFGTGRPQYKQIATGRFFGRQFSLQ